MNIPYFDRLQDEIDGISPTKAARPIAEKASGVEKDNNLAPVISANTLVITDNFEQLKAGLIEQIKLYEIEVTDDNLSDAKKMATELNKLSTAINRIKIDKAKEFAAPIEEFKKKAAELIDIVQSGREKILKQIEAFDLRVIRIVTSLLADERANLFEAMAVKPEFQTAKIESLAIKSNLTAGGQLTKAAKDRLVEMVASDHAMQETVESRFANLQAIAERAGLVSLPESLVSTFVREPEAVYSEKLNKLIDAEIKRQKELEEKIREKEIEKLKQTEPVIVAQPPIINKAAKEIVKTYVAEKVEPEIETTQRNYRVEFMGTVSTGQTSDTIIEWLEMLEAGQSLVITKE
jgi:hypothetical protein